MKRFFLAVFTVFVSAAVPCSVTAAMPRLPVGSVETLVEDAINQVDYIRISISGWSANGDFIANTYSTVVFVHTLADGHEESVSELARRSVTELEAFIGAELKKGVEATIQANSVKLVGRRIVASYSLKAPIIQWSPRKGGHGLIDDDYWSEVFQTPPQTIDSVAFRRFKGTVSLVESLKRQASTDSRNYPLTVPGIARARMTEEDENGNPVNTADSVEATEWDVFSTVYIYATHPLVYPLDDTLFVPLSFVLGGKGTLRIWYRDGSEQVFRRQDGENLITYLSPPVAPPGKRLGVPRVTGKGVELPYEARDDEQVLISRAAPDFKSWEPLHSLPVYPPVVPTGVRPTSDSLPVRIRTATAPRDNGFGFYRAEVVSPVAPQEGQKR